MWNPELRTKIRKACHGLLWTSLCMLVTLPVFAGDAPPPSDSAPAVPDTIPTVTGLTAQGMLDNIALQVPTIMRMVTAIAYVLGMYFIYFSLMKFKQFGEQRTMMSSQHHLREPLTYLIIGTFLLYLPSAVQTGLGTFWADPNPYGYEASTDEWAPFFNNVYLVVQLFGTIAFIRGLIILSHTGHGGQQGQVGKGITHVIGGIFCINIYQFIQLVLNSLGVEIS